MWSALQISTHLMGSSILQTRKPRHKMVKQLAQCHRSKQDPGLQQPSMLSQELPEARLPVGFSSTWGSLVLVSDSVGILEFSLWPLLSVIQGCSSTFCLSLFISGSRQTGREQYLWGPTPRSHILTFQCFNGLQLLKKTTEIQPALPASY